ncbi:MAG: response regulator [Desulfomonile tiedjei]|nr:response regulator [Desulfomonile tiedjei]
MKKRRSDREMVLLDAMMPGMNGFTVAERIRNGSDVSNVPIIMVTVLSSPEDRRRAFEAGVNDFVGKPIDRWDLKARMESLFKLQEGQAETGA